MAAIAVIAKYREDMSWINELRCPTMIYDKSKDIPNVGREAETYLRYIIENYHSLPDHVIFLQGKPFDHLSGGTIEFLNRSISQRGSDVQFLGTTYMEPPDACGLRTTASFKALFTSEPPATFVFSPGAQYVVPKQNILCRPKSFYETIRRVLVDFDKGRLNGSLVCAWTLERMWTYIFDPSISHRELDYSSLL
jgi:hypothetical protein